MDKRKRKKKKMDVDEVFDIIDGVYVHKVQFNDLNLIQNPETPIQLSEIDKYKDVIVYGDSKRNCTIESVGYGSIRATHGTTIGTFYFEVKIENPKKEPAHTRIGWAKKHSELCVPFGIDQNSYSYRDIKGDIFNKNERKDYGRPYGKGDIIGCLIHLNGYEVKEYPTKIEEMIQDGKEFKFIETYEPILISQGSFIKFYQNGLDQGIAFKDIEAGKYYPAISLYGGANVSFIFDRNSLNYSPKDLNFSTF